MRDMSFRAVIIFGHEEYYPRFGFDDAAKYGITTAEGENFAAFMALPLCEGALGIVRGKFYEDAVFHL
jgi:predicted N-acetyltransferase YhbS